MYKVVGIGTDGAAANIVGVGLKELVEKELLPQNLPKSAPNCIS